MPTRRQRYTQRKRDIGRETETHMKKRDRQRHTRIKRDIDRNTHKERHIDTEIVTERGCLTPVADLGLKILRAIKPST